MSENSIVKSCIDILNAYKIFSWRNNTGAVKTEKRFIRFGAKGSPDIIAVYGGQFLGIECKFGKGKQSQSQKDFQIKLEEAGGIYLLVNNPDDLIEFIKKNNYSQEVN